MKINKTYYLVEIANRIGEEFGDIGMNDERAVELIKESIDETIAYYENTFEEIEDWEVFENDLYSDAKRKLGLS